MKIKRMMIGVIILLLLGTALGVFSGCSWNEPEVQGEDVATESQTNASVSESEAVVTESTTVEQATQPAPDVITVACIGDSITEGVGVLECDNDRYSYPAQLGEALGAEYKVLNYGKSGATMCSSSTALYQSKCWFGYSGYYSKLLKNAKDIDVALIMLGTNDGNSGVAEIGTLLSEDLDAFRKDYANNLTRMVNELRARNADMRIYLLTVPKCYRTGTAWEQTLNDVVRPMQKALAEELKLEIFDMYEVTAQEGMQVFFTDDLHLGMGGYARMAEALAEKLTSYYGTEEIPQKEETAFFYEESFDSIENNTVLKKQYDTVVSLGESRMRFRLKEESFVAIENGVLSMTRSAAETDAFWDILLDHSLHSGKITFEMNVKASETYNTRGCLFLISETQIVKINADGSLTNVAGKNIGSLPKDRFMNIKVVLNSEENGYEIYFDDVMVDEGAFAFKDLYYFRPAMFFASGDSTLYFDRISVYQKLVASDG